MKKQAIAFFTMFSLLLMLAIYYITLPEESANSSVNDISVISEISENTQEGKEEEMEKNDEIISDPDSNEEEKNEAILKNETLKANRTIETDIQKKLQEMGYETNVEIKEKTIYVTIAKEKDEEIAKAVMKAVYEEIQDKYFIEVGFNS